MSCVTGLKACVHIETDYFDYCKNNAKRSRHKTPKGELAFEVIIQCFSPLCMLLPSVGIASKRNTTSFEYLRIGDATASPGLGLEKGGIYIEILNIYVFTTLQYLARSI